MVQSSHYGSHTYPLPPTNLSPCHLLIPPLSTYPSPPAHSSPCHLLIPPLSTYPYHLPLPPAHSSSCHLLIPPLATFSLLPTHPLSNSNFTMSLWQVSIALIRAVPPLTDWASMLAPASNSIFTISNWWIERVRMERRVRVKEEE